MGLHRTAIALFFLVGLVVPSEGNAEGDIAAGRARAAVCAGCHGAEGITTNPGWPNLAGQNYTYLVKRLKEFRDGTREQATMSAMASPLSDLDIRNLSAYFASLR